MEFMFNVQINQRPQKQDHTKRIFLKKLATLFDPRGLLTTYTMGSKILLQEMWASSVDWDQPINENLSFKAARWFQELPAVVNILIS